jgi:sigma-B regulation protein RsbU (phosphoserine phosphatase)
MGLGTEELMARANSLFRESALPTQYATMIYGKATRDGELEIVNAGHLPVLLTSASGTTVFESTNQPLGIFANQQFRAEKQRLHPGDTLVLYTDGISEAENDGGDEYGIESLRQVIEQHCRGCAVQVVGACKEQLDRFRGSRERFDDETLLALQYAPAMTQQPQHREAAVV